MPDTRAFLALSGGSGPGPDGDPWLGGCLSPAQMVSVTSKGHARVSWEAGWLAVAFILARSGGRSHFFSRFELSVGAKGREPEVFLKGQPRCGVEVGDGSRRMSDSSLIPGS